MTIFYICIVVNNTLELIIGEPATVREDVEVIIDCKPLIDVVRSLTGLRPRVTWNKNGIMLKNGSEKNVVISQDKRFLIITATLRRVDELGTSGNYSCRVCREDTNIDCITNSSHHIVCGM